MSYVSQMTGEQIDESLMVAKNIRDNSGVPVSGGNGTFQFMRLLQSIPTSGDGIPTAAAVRSAISRALENLLPVATGTLYNGGNGHKAFYSKQGKVVCLHIVAITPGEAASITVPSTLRPIDIVSASAWGYGGYQNIFSVYPNGTIEISQTDVMSYGSISYITN